MSSLNRLTVRARLFLAFGLTIAIFTGFGVFSLVEIETLGKLTRTLYQHPLNVSNAALDATASVVEMHRLMENKMLAKDHYEVQAAAAAIRKIEAEAYEALDQVAANILGAEGKALEKEVRALFDAWRPIRDKEMRLVAAGDRETLAVINQGEAAAQVARLENKLHELNHYARAKADDFMADAESQGERVRRVTVESMVAVAIITMLLAFFLLRSILGYITSLKNKMASIVETGELVPVEVVGRNEIAEMAEHFNALVVVLGRQMWLRSEINRLNETLSGGLPYDDLVEHGLRFVARHVGACAGALYGWDGGQKRCELRSGYALAEGKAFPQTFAAGEGAVGQVAAERRAILLTNISQDQALVQTGTTSAPPRTIYAVPLVYEDTLHGVLEVASFERFDDAQHEFLDAAGTVLASFLSAAAQALRVEQLLGESQRSNEELQTTSEELRSTNEELGSANEELRSQAEELRARSEELQAQTLELEAQRTQLQAADRLKSEFLSNMSHELRTPLNSILALSQLMTTRGLGKNPQQEGEYLGVIERNGHHLLNLINDILDLSRIEAGYAELSPGAFSPVDVFERALPTIRPLLADAGLALTTQWEPAPTMVSDADKVHQILLNLLSNAVKFTEEGTIHVALTSRGDEVCFLVQDSGIGISQEDQSHIFDEFRQIDGSTTRRHEGTGLGLAISQKLARLLGGEITVDSVLGQGSTFTLTLPRNWPGVGEPAAPLPALLEAETPKTSAEGPVVLVIDDERAARETLVGHLTAAGYQVVQAHAGKEGLRMARELHPFAITLDVLLPKMDGWEVLRELKASTETAEIPVIMVSVSDDQETGLALGADGHLVKPVDPRALLAQIEKVARTRPVERILVVDDDPLERDRVGQTLRQPRPPTPVRGPRRILVVEDNEVAVLQIRSALEMQGYEVVVATGGAEGLAAIEERVPDAIVLDLMMPEVDGFQVLEQLRSTPATMDLPVLVLTAKELTRDDRQRLSRNHIQQLVQKGSVNRDQLVERVAQLFPELASAKDSTAPAPTPVAPPALAGGLPRPVLVVDDNSDNLLAATALLEELEVPCCTATDGEQAVRLAREVQPALILMDLQLPLLSGHDALGQIKADPVLCHTPVVALTAQAMKGDRERILADGFDGYLPKPIDPQQLAEVVRKWLG